jgi:hypothetical protein
MSWVAVAIGGSAVLGGVLSHGAANRQEAAARRAAQQQLEMYQQTRSDLMPWQQAGRVGLNELMMRLGLQGDRTNANFGQLTHQFGLSDFQESPAYQFNLQQGKQALDKAAAARGRFYNPSTLQDIAKFSQGLASNEYQNAFSNYQTNMGNIWNRLFALSGTGQNAAAQQGAFGSNAANAAGAYGTQGANAAAAGMIGMGNALTSGIGNYLNYNMLQQMMAGNQGSSVNMYPNATEPVGWNMGP